MKKFLFSAAAILVLIAMHSCNENKPKTETEEFRDGLTAADTAAMLDGCDFCMQLLKEGKIEQALDSIYEYIDSTASVVPLSPELRARYTRNFQIFPVHDYLREYYSFQLEGLNDVRYKIRFSPDESEREAYTAFMFNPVRVDGRWYVTVKTADQDAEDLH